MGPPSYLRECERRGKRWIRLQMVPSRGEWATSQSLSPASPKHRPQLSVLPLVGGSASPEASILGCPAPNDPDSLSNRHQSSKAVKSQGISCFPGSQGRKATEGLLTDPQTLHSIWGVGASARAPDTTLATPPPLPRPEPTHQGLVKTWVPTFGAGASSAPST